jgi:hypothetical protein
MQHKKLKTRSVEERVFLRITHHILRKNHLPAILALVHAEFERAAAVGTLESFHFDRVACGFP